MPGILLFLEQIQVLNLETREMVIERVLALDTAEFDLEDLKWVILMVLFNIQAVKCLSTNGRIALRSKWYAALNLIAATSVL